MKNDYLANFGNYNNNDDLDAFIYDLKHGKVNVQSHSDKTIRKIMVSYDEASQSSFIIYDGNIVKQWRYDDKEGASIQNLQNSNVSPTSNDIDIIVVIQSLIQAIPRHLDFDNDKKVKDIFNILLDVQRYIYGLTVLRTKSGGTKQKKTTIGGSKKTKITNKDKNKKTK